MCVCVCVCVRVRVTEGATLLLNVRNVTERLPRITNQRRQSVTAYLSQYLSATHPSSAHLVCRCSPLCNSHFQYEHLALCPALICAQCVLTVRQQRQQGQGSTDCWRSQPPDVTSVTHSTHQADAAHIQKSGVNYIFE